MDDREFSNQLCAWVNPESVLQVAQLYQSMPAAVDTPFEIRFPRAVPENAKSIGLDKLVDKFLHCFEFPGEYLELLAVRNPQISKNTWDWIAKVHFKGNVIYEEFPPGTSDHTVILLNDRLAATQILSGPIDFLIQYTASFVPLWRSTRGGFSSLPPIVSCQCLLSIPLRLRLARRHWFDRLNHAAMLLSGTVMAAWDFP